MIHPDPVCAEPKLFVGGLRFDVSREEVVNLFQNCGPVKNCVLLTHKDSGKPKGCAMVLYHKWAHAEAAVEQNNNQPSELTAPRPLIVKFADPQRRPEDGMIIGVTPKKLFVGQIPKGTSPEQIRTLFAPYGDIVDLNIMPPKRETAMGCAFVTYSTWASAETAMESLNNMMTLPGAAQPIMVKLADAKPQDIQRVGAKRGHMDMMVGGPSKRQMMGGFMGKGGMGGFGMGMGMNPMMMGMGMPGMGMMGQGMGMMNPGMMGMMGQGAGGAAGGAGGPGGAGAVGSGLTGAGVGDPSGAAQGAGGMMPGQDGSQAGAMAAYSQGMQQGMAGANMGYGAMGMGNMGMGMGMNAMGGMGMGGMGMGMGMGGMGMGMMGMGGKGAALGIGNQNGNLQEAKAWKLFIGQISFDMSEADLFPFFSQFGTILELVLLRNPGDMRHRGCGFVVYNSNAEAESAIANANGTIMPNDARNRPIMVKYATQK